MDASAGANNMKAEGNSCFKSGDYSAAAACYGQALVELTGGASATPSEHMSPAEHDTFCTILCNRAMAHLKGESFAAAEADCSIVLGMSPVLCELTPHLLRVLVGRIDVQQGVHVCDGARQ